MTQFELEVQVPGGKTPFAKKVLGWKGVDIDRAARERNRDAGPAFAFEIEDGIGRLTLCAFDASDYERVGTSFDAFLESSFAALQASGAVGLIIDVRGNGGGRDAYGKILFSYLAKSPFDYYQQLGVRAVDFAFLEHTDAKGRTPPPGTLAPNEDGTRRMRRHPNLGEQQAREPGFAGKVAILMDGGSFSTTCEFLSLAKHHDVAVFVGEESGGTMVGNTSGMVPTLTLPHSKIEVRVPLVRYAMAVDVQAAGRGTLPDHHVEATIEELLKGADPALERARELVKR